MIVVLHPAVDSDLLQAMEYYERESAPEVALEFYSEFRTCADVIARRPYAFLRKELRITTNEFPAIPISYSF